MHKYLHKVAGIYSSRTAAEKVRSQLIEQGFDLDQTNILISMDTASDAKIEPEGNEVLSEVVKDGVIGTVVGSGVGALGAVAMAAANISLFLASPLLGPLTLIGWGASVGAIAGASVGTGIKEGRFSDIVKEALNHGNAVLIVHTTTDAQTKLATEIVSNSVAEPDAIQST
ncbi:MAG: hypothetical protein V4528_07980 [Pseudomonadota bacterium]